MKKQSLVAEIASHKIFGLEKDPSKIVETFPKLRYESDLSEMLAK